MEKKNGAYFKLTPEQYAAAVAAAKAAGLPVEYGTHRDREANLHLIPRGTWAAAAVTAVENAINNAK